MNRTKPIQAYADTNGLPPDLKGSSEHGGEPAAKPACPEWCADHESVQGREQHVRWLYVLRSKGGAAAWHYYVRLQQSQEFGTDVTISHRDSDMPMTLDVESVRQLRDELTIALQVLEVAAASVCGTCGRAYEPTDLLRTATEGRCALCEVQRLRAPSLRVLAGGGLS